MMKKGAAAIAAASFCFVASMVQAGPNEDCAAAQQKALKEVEALYQGAGLPKPDQDRYKSLHETATKPIKPKGPGGGALGICQEKVKKLAGLKQSLLRLISPQVGDRARGGIVFQISDGGKHGLVADASDVPSVGGGGMIFVAADQACNQSTAGSMTDWYVPNSQELSKLYEQKNVVGGFNAHRQHYWSSSKMAGDRYQQMKVYWQMFGNGQTGWSDTSDSGPNRAIFNVRCIRKY